MNRSGYIINILSGPTTHKKVWTGRSRFSIGFPAQYTLDRVEGGIAVRSLVGGGSKMFKLMSYQELTKPAQVTLQDGLELSFEPVKTLPMAYQTAEVNGGQLRAYRSRGAWTAGSCVVGSRFHGILNREIVFSLKQNGLFYELDSFTDDLSAFGNKVGRCKSLKIDVAQFDGQSFTVGDHRWNFINVEKTETVAFNVESRKSNVERQYFNRSFGGALLGLALLLGSIPFFPKQSEELIPTQFAHLVITHPFKNLASRPQGGASRKAVLAQRHSPHRANTSQTRFAGTLGGVKFAQASRRALKQSSSMTDFSTSAADTSKLLGGHSHLVSGSAPSQGTVGTHSVKLVSLSGDGAGGSGYGHGSRGLKDGRGHFFVSLDTSGSDVADGLSKDEVGAVIHRHLSEIRYCYEAATLRDAGVEGRLSVHFTIDPPGTIGSARVAGSTLSDSGLGACIVKRMKTWDFPRPRGGVSVAVNYPFLFKTLGR